jgi:hypothetical protein
LLVLAPLLRVKPFLLACPSLVRQARRFRAGTTWLRALRNKWLSVALFVLILSTSCRPVVLALVDAWLIISISWPCS